MAPLLSRRPVTYRCALYGASPVVASFTANATTIRTTSPMTTKAVNGLISATIALRGSANRARSGLCLQGHCGAVARAARREAARAEKMALPK